MAKTYRKMTDIDERDLLRKAHRRFKGNHRKTLTSRAIREAMSL